MASQDESETLETLLNKATNPMNRDEDWEYIMNFCDRVNVELEGPEIACRLLGHKMQSPQEREALQALIVVEACVKNCGECFHKQIGKFRFLNEMIKLISPKYLGAKSPESVKKKVIEMMYSWQAGLPQEPKIIEAYQMLKKQGLVKDDPAYMDKEYFPPPPPRPKNAAFEDEEKSKLLARLLKSKHPEDLQAANRLIKNMVKEDEKKTEKVSRRMNELESCNNNVKLLSEMLDHYQSGVTSEQEMELMKELYIACEKMRPNLFRLASDSEEKDDGIADVLQTNDSLVKVMELYKDKIGLASLDQPSSPALVSNVAPSHLPTAPQQEDSLLDLSSLDPVPPPAINASNGMPSFAPFTPPSTSSANIASTSSTTQPSSTQLLQDQLSSFGISNSAPSPQGLQSSQGFVRNSVTKKTSPSVLESMMGPPPASAMSNYNIQRPTGPSVFDIQQATYPLQTRMGAPVAAIPTASGAAGMMVRPHQPLGPTIPPTGMSPGVIQGGARPPQYSRTMSGGGAAPPQFHSPFADLENLGKSMVQQQLNDVKQPLVSTPRQAASSQPLVQPAAPPSQVPNQTIPSQGVKQPETQPMPQPTSKPTPAAPTLQPSLLGVKQPSMQGTLQSVTQATTQMLIQPTAQGTLQAATQPVIQGTAQQGTQPMSVGSTPPAATGAPAQVTVLSLADVFVPLDNVEPSTTLPITAYEKNLIKTVLHFAKNVPRPDITVLVVSTMSSNPSPIKNVVFQAAVPKTMRVKLQPPSATDLPAFNPIKPPSAITQVMLIANPQKEKVRLKFKMQYTLKDQVITDVGEVDKFPV